VLKRGWGEKACAPKEALAGAIVMWVWVRRFCEVGSEQLCLVSASPPYKGEKGRGVRFHPRL
jgi:hypothetical protein